MILFHLIDSVMPFTIWRSFHVKKDQIEKKNSQSSVTKDKTEFREEVVQTHKVPIIVAVEGCLNNPAIITYHDLGLNYRSCFLTFFNYIEMRALLKNFCVYHINAPGQEEGAYALPKNYIFPTMNELGAQIDFVLVHFNIRHQTTEVVLALILVNCGSTVAGWIEWGYQKLNARYLRSKGMTQQVLDYMMWHHFGRNIENRNSDITKVYKLHFEENINPINLALFIESYLQRSDLNIIRKVDSNKDVYCNTISTPILNITGAFSPYVEDTVTLNGRLDPTNSSWIKISDCGMALEEQPAKVSQAFRLFLQGEGYAINLK